MKKIFLVAISFLALGCASTYFDVNVDSLAAPDAHQKKKYVIVPANKDITQDDLQFKEYAALIAKSLSENGFISSTPEDADIFIGLSYSIGVAGQTHSSFMGTYTPPPPSQIPKIPMCWISEQQQHLPCVPFRGISTRETCLSWRLMLKLSDRKNGSFKFGRPARPVTVKLENSERFSRQWLLLSNLSLPQQQTIPKLFRLGYMTLN